MEVSWICAFRHSAARSSGRRAPMACQSNCPCRSHVEVAYDDIYDCAGLVRQRCRLCPTQDTFLFWSTARGSGFGQPNPSPDGFTAMPALAASKRSAAILKGMDACNRCGVAARPRKQRTAIAHRAARSDDTGARAIRCRCRHTAKRDIAAASAPG